MTTDAKRRAELKAAGLVLTIYRPGLSGYGWFVRAPKLHLHGTADFHIAGGWSDGTRSDVLSEALGHPAVRRFIREREDARAEQFRKKARDWFAKQAA